MQQRVIDELHGIDGVILSSLPATTAELQAALAAADHRSTKSVVQLALQRLRSGGVVIERQEGAYHAQTLLPGVALMHERRRIRDLATRAETAAGMYPTPDRVQACRLMQQERAAIELEVREATRLAVLERRLERDQAERDGIVRARTERQLARSSV
jgi:hypothetical protein